MVKSENKISKAIKWYPASCITRFRDDEIPMYKKKFKRVLIERRFIKEASVFAAWKTDDFGVLKKCLEHDSRYWKVHTKVLKDRDDYKNLVSLVKKNLSLLKA
jgi:hypothetical protein